MTPAFLVVAYLGAILAANLALAAFGPRIAPVNGALLVGLDLVARDRLHDAWGGRLVRNMAALIVTGSVLSWLFGLALGEGPFIGRIALASAVAFGCAATVDALVYHRLRRRDWHTRVSGSNLVSAGVDSFVFVLLWPYGFQLVYALTLWAAKVGGATAWALLLAHARIRSLRTDNT